MASRSHARPVGGSLAPKRSTRDLATDRVIAEAAERQHGVVARRQLLELGLSDARIKGRVSRGHLHAIHRGVYAVGHRILSTEGRWMAAVLACGSGAALSHRSAGELWRLLRHSAGPIETTRLAGWRAPSGVLIHRGLLPADETVEVHGITVTTPPRTLFDLAAVASRRQLEQALNEAEVQGLHDRLSLPDLLDRYPRRRGSVVLRELLSGEAVSTGITSSELEERFVSLLDAYGLPRPRLNADIAVADRFFSVDCLWLEQRLIVELDGRAVHGTAKAFEADRERDRLLLLDGWRVMRVTWRQLRDHEASIAADLQKALASL